MKSRNSAKVSKKSKSAGHYRKSLRGVLRSFETLEDRKLLTVAPWSDGMFYPPIGLATGFLPTSISPAVYASRSAQQFGGGGGGGDGGLHGEGTQPFISAHETEPNNNPSQANFVNLGSLPSQSDGVAIVGNLSVPMIPGFGIDEDYFTFDLRAGDILDARVNGMPGKVFDLSILDASRREIIGTNSATSNTFIGIYPETSPLNVNLSNPNADLAVVIPQSGRYYARVSDGDSAYTLTMRVRRPFLETQPVGTKQIVFLDFDGAFIRRDIFGAGLPGTARLSPLADFLPDWGLTEADENRVIDGIIDVFASKFVGPTAVSATGGNGLYRSTGVAGHFDIEILNSRDHADPFGQPHVSRIIIGGTIDQLLIPTIGLAQSVDTGNFDTAETAVVLLDLIEPQWGQMPRAGNITLETVLVDAIGSIAAHEAGHLFGVHHTLNTNAAVQLNDNGGTLDIVGQGPDGIYGTADDINVQFGTDAYDPLVSPWPFGRQNSAAAVAFGLSTGTVGGGTIRGSVFNDRNQNQVRDGGDLPLANVVIYADANNNGRLDQGEMRVVTDVNGNYQMTVPPGSYSIRQVIPSGYQLVKPSGNAHVVTVAANQTLVNRDFVNVLINPSITGYKWNDLNGNGIRDAGEPGIGGVYIYIDLDNDRRIDIGEPAVKTNADGSFKLSFPGPGTYTIREVVQPGYSQTYPGMATGGEHVIVLTGDPAIDGPRMTGLNFGNRLTIDYGDAPASYGVAGHGFLAGLTLGTLWDAELSSLHSSDALGDDRDNLNDEDAIDLASLRPLVKGSNGNPVNIATTNTTGQTAYLQGWIDFNQNGVFDAGEQVIKNLPVTAAGLGTLSIAVPNTSEVKLGTTFLRLRLSLSPDIGPTGLVLDGEVEDYAIRIVDQLVLAVNDTATVARNSVLNPIDVLANDYRQGNETLEIINVSNPSTAGGAVTFTPSTVLYTPARGFIGRDSFTYQMRNSTGETASATVSIDVNLFFENPLAVDDSFDVPTNSIDFPLNVLANDIEGQDGALSIFSVTQPSSGTISIANGNKSLRYTPSRDFGGTETFTYTAEDAAGKRTTARVTLHTLPGARADDQLQIRLRVTNEVGQEISAIQQGQRFRLEMLVDDLRFPSGSPATDVDAGVFAAYADLLYNYQLVSTVAPGPNAPAGFNFDVQFDQLNRYVNGQRGDATVPGIIDEFGAFFDGTSMNRPNEVRLASITFEAKSPGIARFMADPADVAPASDSLLFDTSSTPVPLQRIRYLGTSLEIVGDGVVFPVAVDDSLPTPIPLGAIQFPIDVLANDLPGSSGPITLTSVTNGLHGTTRINAGKVEYTPNLGTTGTADQFTYTMVDNNGNRSTANVTVRLGNNASADDIVGLRLGVTDLNGNPISRVTPGSQFQLRGYVRDLRTSGAKLGIFAAYQDVLYSSQLVMPVSSASNPLGFEVQFGETPATAAYDRVIRGDIRTPGIINEIGAVSSGDSPLGSGEQLMFIVTMQAKNVTGERTATFIGDPADISPFHDTLTFEPVSPVRFDKITYGFASIVIGSGGSTVGGEGEFHNADNPFDVNGDGFVSPIDALAVINALNSGGSRPLYGGAGGEGESSTRLYIDTNGDNFLSPIDALNVINYLNSQSVAGASEGEGESSVAVLTATPAISVFKEQGQDDLLIKSVTSIVEASGLALPAVQAPVQQAGQLRDELVAATDGIFESNDDSSDSIEELLNQLAPEIEMLWKKR